MNEREKLTTLFYQAVGILEVEKAKWFYSGDMESPPTLAEILVEHLLANGVTVQEWISASKPPKEDGTYLVQTNTGKITTARFYAFKSFSATKYLPACHRSPSWQSNRNVVKWTFLPQPPKGE